MTKNKALMNIGRIIYSELRISITWSKIAILLATTFFALLSLIIQDTQNPITNQTNIIRAVGEGTTYALLIRLFYSFRDKSTLDRNRVAYLLFGKQAVAFGKVLGDVILFFLQIFIIIVVAPLIVKAKDLPVNTIPVDAFAIYIVTMTFFFAFTIIGVRFITAVLDEKALKWFAVSLWILMTTGTYLVMAVVTALPGLGIGQWFADNGTWIAFVPGMNFVIPSLLLSSYDLALWVPFMMAIETLFICILVWKRFASELKTYLTT